MKHLFVPYELAKRLKEQGFDEPCLETNSNGLNGTNLFRPWIRNSALKKEYNPHESWITIPSYQQVVDWIREKGIVISVYNNASGYLWNMAKTAGGTNLADSDYDGPNDSGCWDEYYGALEHGIEQALKRIK